MTNTITTKFTDEYKRQAPQYSELLFDIATKCKPKPTLRVSKANEVTESYFNHTGEPMDAESFEILADMILMDELLDTHPDKMTRKEYPIMSDSQQEERYSGEVDFEWASNVGTNYVDYTIGTRDNMRKRRIFVGSK